MNILIVEGSSDDVEMFQRVIKKVGSESRLLITTRDIETSLEFSNKSHDPDIIFLCTEKNSAEKIKILRKLHTNSPIIHRRANALTAHLHSDFAELSLEENDFAKTRARKAEEIFAEISRSIPEENSGEGAALTSPHAIPKQRFLIRSPNKLKSVSAQEIAYVYADKKLNFFRTWENNKLIADFTIEQLTRLLDPDDFFRVNRSFMVSYRSIRDIHVRDGNRLKLVLHPQTEDEVFVSRDRVSAFRKWIGEGA